MCKPGFVLQDDEKTCAMDVCDSSNCAQDCVDNNSNSVLVGGDETIRPFGADGETYCFFKRWMGFANGQDVWVWPCNPNHGSGKYRWSYDSSTGLILSQGSIVKNPAKPFCLNIVRAESLWSQRVKILRCDETMLSQQWDFVDGKIVSRANPNVCIGWTAGGKSALTTIKCHSNNFAYFGGGTVGLDRR